MREFFKNLIILFFVFSIITSPAFAKEKVRIISNLSDNFSVTEMPDEIHFKTPKKVTIQNVTIPQRSIVTAQTIQAQKERRWHKSGYILCKVTNYLTEYDELIDVSDKDIYLVARKYEPVNKKAATILATEIILAQAAAVFAPGVDILYFFTKGAIIREKHYNWFKAGVSNAYDNSICWFWLKGKPIDLEKDDQIQIKQIKEEKVFKLKDQIEKRKAKQAIKDENHKFTSKAKQDKKAIKKYIKKELRAKNKKPYSIINSELKNETYPSFEHLTTDDFLIDESPVEYEEM